MDRQNQQPYIIIKGETPAKPVAYYIIVDNEAVHVSIFTRQATYS